MSLQVWLPMTANFNNQGVANSTITNTGVVLNDSGKLGKCGNFASSKYLSGTVDPSSWTEVSIALWIKPPAGSSGNKQPIAIGTASGWTNIRAGLVYQQNSTTMLFSISDGTNSINYNFGISLTADTWQHIVATYKNGVSSWYLNGVLQKTYTTSFAPNFSGITKYGVGAASNGNEPFTGYMNDVRIYSHCLSAKEVAEIAKGLVLHYPLNFCNENILIGTMRKEFTTTNSTSRSAGILYAGSGGNGTFSVTEDSTVPCGILSWNVLNNTSGNRDFQQAPIPYVSGNKYTVSWWSKGNGTQLFRVWNQNAGGEVFRATWTLTTEWKYYTYTFTANDAMQNQVCTWHLGVTGSASINMCGMKLELGEKATPWSPNSADLYWNPMGYNNNIEYDVSGYGYNGTRTGSITWISDTPRYSVSTHFVNGSYIMSNTNCPNMLPTDALTVNLWVKPTTWGTPVSCTEGGGWNFEETGSGLQFQFYVAAVGYKPAKCSITGASLQDGKWHMLTGTFSSTNKEVKFYIDGDLKATASTGSANGCGYANNRLIISGEAQYTTPTSSTFVGEESDVRIYATCLTADQVQELYNTPVSITNNGVLMTQGSFVES